MGKVQTDYLDFSDLERLDLKTITENGTRFYVDSMGTKLPSVTTVVGLKTRDQIQLWRKRVGEEEANRISQKAARRGTAFHDKVEQYLRREDDYIEFNNLIEEGMFKGIRGLLDQITPLAIECPLYSPTLSMAGRVDCVGIFEDALAIIDFKTSAKYKKEEYAESWYLQMTAYAIMVEELTGEAIDELCAIVAIEDGNYQLFVSEPHRHVEELVSLRNRYKNLYGV